ncbi:metallophosphoesterase [Umezawaea sp. Da 62-37]|uniref:metallophosphoesterase n=1 Tax=Umezawaea sp. Da 62-37 TaxID=3075927 RepID=UPI0028F6FFF4|nr:metallophosphoesterase [Umezawaea sp. Da 62-37]WNV89593.1 metallophosphoesterase [Umezawaea sp. Da 62-37]
MIFLLLLGVPCGLAHLYLWKRLVRDTTRPGRGRALGTAAVVVMFLVLLGGLAGSRLLGPGAAAFLAWPGYLWLAMVLYLTLLLLVLEVPRALLNRRLRPVQAPAEVAVPAGPDEPVAADVADVPEDGPTDVPADRPADPGRRLFIARSLAVAGGVVATGVVGYGVTQAMGGPVVKRVPIALGKLAPAFDGFRIAVVSDIHLGPLLGRSHTERVVNTINGLQPDLVAIVGDLVDGSVEELGEAAAPLRDLVSAHGSFFVTGNHEYFSGAQPWLAELSRLGVHPLRNELLAITRGGAAFDLAGVNDVTGKGYGDGPDMEKALERHDTSTPVVLLAHQPVQAVQAAGLGVDLQLSGHTHGGQMWPFNYAVSLQQPVVSGLAEVGGMPVYVSNGAGFWGPPVRVGAPPDVTLVELRNA